MIEWASQKLRKGYAARRHLDPHELDLPRLGETRPKREHRAAVSALYEPSGRVEAAQVTAPTEEGA